MKRKKIDFVGMKLKKEDMFNTSLRRAQMKWPNKCCEFLKVEKCIIELFFIRLPLLMRRSELQRRIDLQGHMDDDAGIRQGSN